MSNIVSKEHKCPYRNRPHKNLAFVVYTNGHYCYSCNKGTMKNDSFYSFKKNAKKLDIADDLLLPNNTASLKEFPTHIKAWLYKYYVFDDIIHKHNIRYCAPVYFQTSNGQRYEGESLLYPVIVEDEIVAYQQRFFPDKQFFSKNLNKHIAEFGNNDSDTVVLVEDFISAIRISEVENCIWLAGTHLTNGTKAYITHNYTHIKVWLDSDEAGVENSKKIIDSLTQKISNTMKWLSFQGGNQKKLSNITTELDPKCYSRSEIEEVLKCM